MAPDEIIDMMLGYGPARALVDLWHLYRIPILLTSFSILLLVRVYLHATSDGPRLLALPKAYANDPQEAVKTKVPEPSAGEKQSEKGRELRRIKGGIPRPEKVKVRNDGPLQIQVLIFYSSLTGSTERAASQCAERLPELFAGHGLPELEGRLLKPKVLNLAEIELDDYFVAPPPCETETGRVGFLYLLLLPSYDIDTINDTFLTHLEETHTDFRIDTSPLSSLLGYSVFGFGDGEGWPTEEAGFCSQAKLLDKWLAKLTARKRAYPLGVGDVKKNGKERLEEWTSGVADVLRLLSANEGLGEGVPGSGDAVESDDEASSDAGDDEDAVANPVKTLKRSPKRTGPGSLDDVEDLGKVMRQAGSRTGSDSTSPPIAVDFTKFGKAGVKENTPAVIKEMVPQNSPTYAALTKQGYSIVGSHSGVKICRWTKSALRGRGSCYKYSFYGIHSHQCMEATPSLSCSNKCVFCWRHGTNPVGTTWRWVVDPPQLIFDGIKDNHYKKIQMLRGVPGVRAERYTEAMRIRHCALSLVGEPIFYPHINEFLKLLHGERISSFLVCNAQHPDQLAALQHVTQLYVSVDASNRESLRRIDRPLHRDFWERFQRCLDILRERRHRQRTVFRLTLVKGFNIEDEVQGYADLVARALPCFVEVKGVTFCGTSTSAGAGLRMSNVPFYHEVCEFVRALEVALRDRGLAYGIAAEHAHSCCILLASERFKVDGKWHTLIDYERFFALLEERGPDGDFSPEDYMGPETPEWATWGNGGFDPRDQRVDRKGRPKTDVVIRDKTQQESAASA